MHVEPKRAVITVPGDLNQPCWEVPVDEVTSRHLREALQEGARTFIHARATHGQRYVDADNIHAYGPFPTAELLVPLIDHETLTAKDRDQLVLQRDSSPRAWNHYLLNANFVCPDTNGGGG